MVRRLSALFVLGGIAILFLTDSCNLSWVLVFYLTIGAIVIFVWRTIPRKVAENIRHVPGMLWELAEMVGGGCLGALFGLAIA